MRIEGFDRGNSPSEFTEGAGETVILTTTNGTRALVAAARALRPGLAACLLNLGAVVAAAQADGEDVAVICAGVKGEFASTTRTAPDGSSRPRRRSNGCRRGRDAARVGVFLGGGRARASQSARNLLNAGLEDDIAWCARESELDVVPRLSRMLDGAAEITL